MRAVYSFGVNNLKLVEAINTFKDNGGNLSRLVCNLLEHYFFSGNNKEVITKEMLLLLDIKKKMDEFLQWREEIMPKIEELEEKLKKKQEEQKLQDELPLIRELRYAVFKDLDPNGPEAKRSILLNDLKLGKEDIVRRAVKARLSKWAPENQLSMPDAIRLFCKAFPELKHLFEVKEEVVR